MSTLRRQDGFALVVAMLVMLVTVLLVGVAVAVSVHTNNAANRNTKSMRALQAADAGLHVASYRLNEFQPDGTHCPTPPTAVGVGATNLCPPDVASPATGEALGNGASFQYWVSGNLASTDPCAGNTVSNGPPLTNTLAQRCITSEGLINGVVLSRVQARVATYTSTPLFPAAIYGTRSVNIGNNLTIQVAPTTAGHAVLGTNGTLTVGNGNGAANTTIDGYALPPGGTLVLPSGGGVTNTGPTTPLTSPWPTLSPHDPGSSWQNTPGGGSCATPVAPAAQTNCNYRIASGQDTAVTPLNPPVFNPTTRVLTLPNNSWLMLTGGVYNFCQLTMGNNSTLSIAPLAQTTIFIDSPANPNSGGPAPYSPSNPPCAAGTGTFTMGQNASLNPGGSALNAQIYVYGNPGVLPPDSGDNVTTLANNSSSAYSLYAPYSAVTLNPSNNSRFKGAIAGYTATLGNAANFTYEADTSSIQAPSLPVYYRTYWEQCTAQPTTADPRSGC